MVDGLGQWGGIGLLVASAIVYSCIPDPEEIFYFFISKTNQILQDFTLTIFLLYILSGFVRTAVSI